MFLSSCLSLSWNALHLHTKGRAIVSRRAVKPACPVLLPREGGG